MSSSVSSPPPRLISDELWALVEPLIPPGRPAVHGRTRRPRRSDREVLEGIPFVLSTGIGWAKLPTELGHGSCWTCLSLPGLRGHRHSGAPWPREGCLRGQGLHRRVQGADRRVASASPTNAGQHRRGVRLLGDDSRQLGARGRARRGQEARTGGWLARRGVR
jgi:transposase